MIEEHRHCVTCGKVLYWNIDAEEFPKICIVCTAVKDKMFQRELEKANREYQEIIGEDVDSAKL